MLAMLTIACAAVAGLFLLPAISDFISLLRLPWQRAVEARTRGAQSRFLFLIPAHDEEQMIVECVRSVQAMRYPSDHVSVIVIADNCTDRTADRARMCGVSCWERNDTALRGKPRALAWALERANLDAYDGVIILDADAIVDPEYAAALDRLAPLRDKAIECYDDVRNRTDSALTRLAAVLSAARFLGSFRLKRALGLTVPLSDGMCIGTNVLREHPWSAFGLSEDWEVYAMLTARGIPIDLAADAHLYAQETHSMRQSTSQRRRWLAGRVNALAQHGPRIISSARINWHQKLDAIAELSSPGPAVQLALCATLTVLLLATHAPLAGWICIALGASLVRPAVYALVGLWHDPEPARAAAAFTVLPFYAAWRFAVALLTLPLLRGGEWVRTARW